MPYTGPDDKTLPSNVKSMDAKMRAKWVAVFNSAFKNAKSDAIGGSSSDKKAETVAFKMANGSVKKSAAEAVTKTEDGKAFPASDFAYVPDATTPSTWKLRLTATPGGPPDAGIVGAAIAALGKGFRGNRVEIPAEDRAAVVGKVRSAWKRAHPDAAPEDMPDTIKAHDNPEQFDGMTAFLSKMRELVATKIDAAEWDTIVKTARASAGGKGKAAARIKVLCEEHRGAIEPVAGCDYCGSYDMPAEDDPKMEKADNRVQYRPATAIGNTCSDCRFFEGSSCELVEGTIGRDMVCDLFTAGMAGMMAYGENEHGQLFVTTRAFGEATPPDWMPYMPVPGTYPHPRYGDIVMSKERLQHFMENFNAGVYQKQIPVDAEHETKLSGAVGWIKQLRQNSDGSLDAKVEWTDRGTALIKAGGYKFVSPEWWDEWVQPETGKVYYDVPIGAAITTRPYFKERSLRALVASETGSITVVEKEGSMTTKEGEGAATTPRTAAEVQAAFDAYRATAEAESKQLAERLKTMEAANITRAFTDEVMGRSDANNIRWIGEPAKHVAVLTKMAEAFGDANAEPIRDYIELNRKSSAAVRAGEQFQEVGSGADGGTGDKTAWGEIQRKANELVTTGKAKTFAEAVDDVTRLDKDLATRYAKERG